MQSYKPSVFLRVAAAIFVVTLLGGAMAGGTLLALWAQFIVCVGFFITLVADVIRHRIAMRRL